MLSAKPLFERIWSKTKKIVQANAASLPAIVGRKAHLWVCSPDTLRGFASFADGSAEGHSMADRKRLERLFENFTSRQNGGSLLGDAIDKTNPQGLRFTFVGLPSGGFPGIVPRSLEKEADAHEVS